LNPDIPDIGISIPAELIRDCLAVDYRDRPSFDYIFERLQAIEFKLILGVSSVKITKYVAAVEYCEWLGSIHNLDDPSKAPAFVNGSLFDERIERLIKFLQALEKSIDALNQNPVGRKKFPRQQMQKKNGIVYGQGTL
jgi:hypothetical protein